ncbi:MAG: hypothetical protein Q9183_007763, partial [Haloplaca sp. 2 TL-2023]
MLYLKESIDATAKEARESARARRGEERKAKDEPATRSKASGPGAESDGGSRPEPTSTEPLSGGQDDLKDGVSDDDEEEEEVIVRGFSGNAVRTERGIQYLGKRLAKYVLSMTYPDQPFLPVKQSMSKSLSRVMTGQQPQDMHSGRPAHGNSS